MLQPLKTSLAPLILRFGLAAIFLFHGYLKIGAGHTTEWNPGMNPTLQAVIAWGEFVCGIALFFGLFTRIAALWIAAEMFGAIALVTGDRGFLRIGEGVQGPEYTAFNFKMVGFEYNFAIIVICATLLILGGGGLSLDYFLWGRRKDAVKATVQPLASPGLAAVE